MSVKRIKTNLQNDKSLNCTGAKASNYMSVCELYIMHTRQRPNVRPNTVLMRKYLLKKLQKDSFGGLDIRNVSTYDAKSWIERSRIAGTSYHSIKNHKRSLSAAFQLAVQNDLIEKNPFDFDVREVVENDSKRAVPLSKRQQKSFLEFIKKDAVYQKNYDEIVIFLGTGLRASELCGLTNADIDFSKRMISVNHQLLRAADGSFYIAPPKTRSSYREIYMTDAVLAAFKNMCLKAKGRQGFSVDGLKKFIFLNSRDEPKTVAAYDALFRRIIKKYKKKRRTRLPDVVTPHTLRHTFCTNMAAAGMNPKSLQYIMGHSSISMTMNYYSHTSFELAKKEMKRIEKQPRISYRD